MAGILTRINRVLYKYDEKSEKSLLVRNSPTMAPTRDYNIGF